MTKDVLYGYSWDMFITAAILCGCDYISNIPRIGSGTAFKLVEEYKDVFTILQ